MPIDEIDWRVLMKKFLTIASCAILLALPTLSTAQEKNADDCSLFDFGCPERKRQERQEAQQRDEKNRINAYYERELIKQQQREEERLKQKAEHDAFVKRQEQEAAERLRLRRERDEADGRAFREQQVKRQAELDAAHIAEVKREQAEAAKIAAAENTKKTQCAGDYRNPQVGMRIERWQECVGTLRVTGQVNRPDGLATLYRGAGYWVNVMAGHVVAWGR